MTKKKTPPSTTKYYIAELAELSMDEVMEDITTSLDSCWPSEQETADNYDDFDNENSELIVYEITIKPVCKYGAPKRTRKEL